MDIVLIDIGELTSKINHIKHDLLLQHDKNDYFSASILNHLILIRKNLLTIYQDFNELQILYDKDIIHQLPKEYKKNINNRWLKFIETDKLVRQFMTAIMLCQLKNDLVKIKNIKCWHCNRTFSSRRALFQHKKDYHNHKAI